MKAVQFNSFGGPEVLDIVDIDAPHPGPGEVVVQVASAGINQLDTKIRSGVMQMGPASFPMGTGLDAAGTVIDIGRGSMTLPRAILSSEPAATPWPNRPS